MILPCTPDDLKEIGAIINDGATAYKGVIPADRWKEPYMPEEELKGQIAQGVVFYKYQENDAILGVMGIQDKGAVTLVRHAYTRTANRGQGIGSKLLQHLLASTTKPVLIGTWAAAVWAIDFYRKHGFRVVSESDKDQLLRSYWNIPERQIETSVVLADSRYPHKI